MFYSCCEFAHRALFLTIENRNLAGCMLQRDEHLKQHAFLGNVMLGEGVCCLLLKAVRKEHFVETTDSADE